MNHDTYLGLAMCTSVSACNQSESTRLQKIVYMKCYFQHSGYCNEIEECSDQEITHSIHASNQQQSVFHRARLGLQLKEIYCRNPLFTVSCSRPYNAVRDCGLTVRFSHRHDSPQLRLPWEGVYGNSTDKV